MKNSDRYSDLTSSSRLGRNATINIGAKIIPLIVGIVAVPVLIDALGKDGFGLLAVIWLIIGYLSMFDLGMSPAIVRSLSERIGLEKYVEIPKLIWSGILFLSGMGLLAGILLFFLTPWLVTSVFNIEEASRESATQALTYTSYAIPFIISASGFKAVLESLQKFEVISFFQGLNSLLNYLLPLIVIWFVANSLPYIVMSLLLVKIIIFLIYAISAVKSEPLLLTEFSFSLEYLKEMIGFGKWITLSSVISSFMGQADRYFVGAFISLTAVTFYTTPLEVLAKVMIVPMSFISVLFPAFSTLSAQPHEQRERLLFESIKSVLVILFPSFLILSAFADIGLNIWLGPEFVEGSTAIARVFCLVYLLRGIAFIPSAYVKALNRPDLIAKFHVAELIALLISLFIMSEIGTTILQVAFLMLIITAIDTFLLLLTCFYLVKQKERLLKQIIYPFCITALFLFGLVIAPTPLIKWCVFTVGMGSYIIYYYQYVVDLIIRIFRILNVNEN